MPELSVDEAKKELTGLADKAKAEAQQGKEKLLSTEEKKSLELKKAEDAKAEETKKLAAEEQSKKDKELLAKKDSDLKAEELKHKQELLKAEEDRKKAEEDKLPSDEKIKRVQEKTQKRIDEISSELKETRNKSEKEVSTLRQELEVLRKEKQELEVKLNPPKDEEIIISEVEKAYEDIRYKNLEEDKEKSIEQRREMTQEDWDAWYLENPKAATAWEVRQETRRIDEKKKEITKKVVGKKTEIFLAQVNESATRTLKAHPELDITKREKELAAEGKSKEEISEIILSENPKAKICKDILQEHPEYLQRANGPELVVTEMERRLAKKDPKSLEESEKAELLKRIDSLEERLADAENRSNLDEGLPSKPREKGKGATLTEGEQKLVDMMREKNAPQDKIDSALKKYRDQK